jgi:hypothetical protein
MAPRSGLADDAVPVSMRFLHSGCAIERTEMPRTTAVIGA